MKQYLVAITLLILFATAASAQSQKDTIKICKGVPIPEGYTIIEETTSADCQKGAYLIKKSSAESETTETNEPAKTSSANSDDANESDSAADDATSISSDTLYLVQKIHVGEMGDADEAERFRLLLEENLSKKGFKVVGKAGDADAILKGVLSTQLAQGTTKARAYVQLKTSNGDILWSRSFGVRMAFRFQKEGQR